MQPGNETWGVDHSIHALKKDATWLAFVKLLPEKDPKIENRMMELRARNNVDELLRVIARFITVTDADVSNVLLYSYVKTSLFLLTPDG